MENKEDDIENLFQERFANDEAPVSPRVWQNIKNTLPEEKRPTGFTFSQNIVLWSITAMLIVSAVIGSFVIFNTNNSATSSITAHPEKERLSVEEIKEYTPSDTNGNTRVSRRNSNHSSYDSLLKNNSDKQTIQQSNNKKANGSNSKVTVLSNYSSKTKDRIDIINNLSSSQKDSLTSTIKNNNAITPIKNKKNTSSTNESLSSARLHNKKTILPIAASNANTNSSDQNEKNKLSSFDKEQSNANPDLSITNQHKKTSSSSFDEAAHTMVTSTDTLSSTNPTGNKTTLRPDSTVSQKYQELNPTLYNSNASIAHSDTINKKNNVTLSFVTSDHTQQTNDSIFSTDDNQAITFNQLVHSHSDSSLTNNSSTIANPSVIQKGSLKNTNLVEQIGNKDSILGSSTSQNDSLSSSSMLTNTSVPDSLMTAMDSIKTLSKDSVLTETTAKKEKIKSNLMKHLSFDIVAAALLTGASTKATDSSYQSAVEDKNKKDKNSLGYSAGIIVNYKLSNRLQASAGIVYTAFSEQYNFNYTVKKFDWVYIDSNWQQIESDSINRDIKAKDQYSFLSIPLQFSYTFLIKEKIRLSATAGIRSNILLKGVTYLPNARKSDVVEVKSGFNSISFSYLIALEAEYKLNAHTALLLQPTFMYGASSIHSKASALSQKPYGVGLTLGLRFIF
ncbi:MAG: hypothetical protein JWM14_1978 [Chitinophagaceae bacterium]|nr:hypothetical protein [Chitinophagaceae bacterium]